MWKTRKERRQQLFNQLHNSDDEMHRISAVHLEMIFEYYDDVLKQAKASFLAAIVLAILGFGVLAYTIYYAMHDPYDSIDASWIGVVCGGLVQFLSAIAFFVYKRATEQFNSFHICLERTNRYLMAYNLDELIEDGNSMKDRARHELACLIADAPMLAQRDLDAKRTTRPTVQNEVSTNNEQNQRLRAETVPCRYLQAEDAHTVEGPISLSYPSGFLRRPLSGNWSIVPVRYIWGLETPPVIEVTQVQAPTCCGDEN